MIVLRFLRTVFGWAFILADTLASALRIGISGEGEVAVFRLWRPARECEANECDGDVDCGGRNGGGRHVVHAEEIEPR